MEPKTKTPMKKILIILLVAAAAFCLYWFVIRKKNDETAVVSPGTGTDSDTPASAGVLDPDYKAIIKGLDTTTAVKTTLLTYAARCKNATGEWLQQIKDKAELNDRTFDAQCVRDGAWLAHDGGKITDEQYQAIIPQMP